VLPVSRFEVDVLPRRVVRIGIVEALGFQFLTLLFEFIEKGLRWSKRPLVLIDRRREPAGR
jgi:hypothetical protein